MGQDAAHPGAGRGLRLLLFHPGLQCHGHSCRHHQQEVSLPLLLPAGQPRRLGLPGRDRLRVPHVQHGRGVPEAHGEGILHPSGSPRRQSLGLPLQPAGHRSGALHIGHELEGPQQPDQEAGDPADRAGVGHLQLNGRRAQPGLELHLQPERLLSAGAHLQQELPDLLVGVQPGGVSRDGGHLHTDLFVRPEEDLHAVAAHQRLNEPEEDAHQAHQDGHGGSW